MISIKLITVALLHFNVLVYSQNSCVTPNEENAECIQLSQCRILQNLIYDTNPNSRQFLKQSQCLVDKVPFVCCGSVAGYAKPSPIRSWPNTVHSSIPNPKQHRNINLLPPLGQCGRESLEDRVVGGIEAGLDEFPWLALLRYTRNGKDQGFHCGGVLINERYVLTAAHCVNGAINCYYGNVYHVRLGEHDTRTLQDCTPEGNCNEPPQDNFVEEVIFHSGYNDKFANKYHDIALLRLSKPVELSYFIQPICLPLNGEQTTLGANMSVAGWGKTEFANKSHVKLKASVPYISHSQCKKIYSGLSSISDDQLCAGGLKDIDSCNGDSGGPIMNLLPDRETWYAEGLVSFGPRVCGTENIPAVYTRIYGYLNWILDNMKA